MPRFYPEPFLVGFVVDRMAVGQVFLLVFQFYFPRLHFTYDPCLFSSMCFSYQKDRRVNLRILVNVGLYEPSPSSFLYSCFSNCNLHLTVSPFRCALKAVPNTLNSRSPFECGKRERERERDYTLSLFRHYPRL
jgi:hypothetical protein